MARFELNELERAIRNIEKYAEDKLVKSKRPNLKYGVLEAKRTIQKEIERLKKENAQMERELGLSPSGMIIKKPVSVHIKCPHCKKWIDTDTATDEITSGCCCRPPRTRIIEVTHSCPRCHAVLGAFNINDLRNKDLFAK